MIYISSRVKKLHMCNPRKKGLRQVRDGLGSPSNNCVEKIARMCNLSVKVIRYKALSRYFSPNPQVSSPHFVRPVGEGSVGWQVLG